MYLTLAQQFQHLHYRYPMQSLDRLNLMHRAYCLQLHALIVPMLALHTQLFLPLGLYQVGHEFVGDQGVSNETVNNAIKLLRVIFVDQWSPK